MKYPKYPAYKDSGVDWIGKVPREWKIKKLKSLTRIQTGITPPTDKSYYYSEELGFPWIKPDDIEESLYPSKASKYLSNEGSKIVKKIDAGSTIVCCIGTIGKLGYVDSVASTNQQINSVKSLSGNDKFIYFALAACKKEMESLASGNVIQILNKKKLGDIFVPLPSDLEMTNIADYLKTQVSKINKLANKIKNFIDVIKEKRQAIITHAVTKGLDHSVPMKDSGVEWIGKIPEYWKLKRLKYVVKLVNDKSERETTQIALENIESWSGKYLVTDDEFKGDGIRFQSGDILFGKLRPYLAKVYLAAFSGAAVGDFFVLRSFSDVESNFLFNWLINREFINMVNSATYGAKMPRIDWGYMGELFVTIPPKEEQIKICDTINVKTSQIDALITKQYDMIEHLKEYKTSLISQAVTGKIDVRGFAASSTSNNV
jgi:restriction endonuclease S subunit